VKKKLLLVASEFPPGPGGIGNHAYSLAKLFGKSNYEVHLVVDSNYAIQQEVIDFDSQLPDNIQINRVRRSGWLTYFRRIKMIVGITRKQDLVGMIFSGKFSLWMCGLLKVLGVKVPAMAVLHGSEVSITDTLQKLLTRWGISKADFLIPVSQFTHSLLSEKLKKRPFRIIANGIDLEEFRELASAADLETLNLKGEPALLTVGNVTPRKGQHRLIKALPEILKEYPKAHYHIVGLPSYKQEFEKLGESLNVEHAITFHGRLASREDLAVAYTKADLFVILSENQANGDVEGFGIVILEANFFGLPAIGAKGCGIADAIDDGYNGYLVDGDDGKDIAQSVRNAFQLKKELSGHSREWANKHDWNNIITQYIEVLNTLESKHK